MRTGSVLTGAVVAALAMSGIGIVVAFRESVAPCPGCPQEMGRVTALPGVSDVGNDVVAEAAALAVSREVTPAVLDRLEAIAFGALDVPEEEQRAVRRTTRLSISEMLRNRTDLSEQARGELKDMVLRAMDDPAASLRLNAVALAENARVFDDPRFVARVEALKNDRDPEVAARASRSSILWTPEQRAEAARRWAEEKDARR